MNVPEEKLFARHDAKMRNFLFPVAGLLLLSGLNVATESVIPAGGGPGTSTKTGNCVDQNPTSQDEKLIERLRLRDREAFSLLYDRYAAGLYGFLLRILRDDQHAGEVLREAFVKVWRSIELYDREKSGLFTWMMHIARDIAAARSAGSKGLPGPQSGAAPDSTGSAGPAGSGTAQNGLVANLNPDQRKLLDLAYFSTYTHEELAEELSMPPGEVKERLRAAVSGVREHLQPEQLL